jgi:predicted ATPase
MRCACKELQHKCGLLVLTGGPGAGKTAVLEIVRRTLCKHIDVLPEAATVLFSGGFPRHNTEPGRRAAQNAIFHVQRAMESIALEEQSAAIALCDRGTLDGLAYWPGGLDPACRSLGIARAAELARYRAVIHMRTPASGNGYDFSNPVRTESHAEALEIDTRIAAAWEGHAHRVFIERAPDFLQKVARAVGAIRDQLPACCRVHPVAELGESAGPGGAGACDDAAPATPGART